MGENTVQSYPPVYNENCRVLIVGTAPSAASLEAGGHYGHRRNAFWPILFALWGESDPGDYPSRYAFMLSHRIALWDVLKTCEREGNLDSAIRDGIPSDIDGLLAKCPSITTIFCNGGKAHELFCRHFPHLQAERLPSTSPAAARLRFEQKLAAWQVVKAAAEGVAL